MRGQNENWNCRSESMDRMRSEMYIKNQIARHSQVGIHLYFQHMGGKNTSHDCYKFKVRLYIVNSRPARTHRKIIIPEKKGREGNMRGREGKEEEGKGGKRERIKKSGSEIRALQPQHSNPSRKSWAQDQLELHNEFQLNLG